MDVDDPPVDPGGGGYVSNAKRGCESDTNSGGPAKKSHTAEISGSVQSTYTIPEFLDSRKIYGDQDVGPYVVHVSKTISAEIDDKQKSGIVLRPIKFGHFLFNNKIQNIKKDGIKRIGRNRVSVEFTSGDAANTFLTHPAVAGAKYEAIIPSFNVTRMGIVRQVPAEWTLEELVTSIEVPQGFVLQQAPNEQKAFHCKVVCFLQLHNFKEALAVLCNPKNAALAADLHFEKAYAQYRLNCPKDALQTVNNAPDSPAIKELRAQILYRLEQYQDCYNLYRDIVKNSTDDYEDERRANMAAVVANLAAVNPNSDLPQLDENTYELAYNAGSTLAMRGKYNEALPVLKRAEQACSESVIEDGGTEEEAKEEAGIIRVQQAYCLQQMGKEKEAASIYQNVLKDKPSDQALIAIASNNLVVINRDTNVFDSRKRMKAATAEGLEHKLNSRQRAAIAYNQAVLAIYSNQPDFCKQCCVKLVREFGQEQRAALVEAASLAKEGKRQQAVTLLMKHGGEHTFAAVQILLAQGDRKSAVTLLEESSYKYRPGVVGALVTLLSADNDLDRASKLFTEVYDHYKKDERFTSLRALWRAAAEAHTRAGNVAAAAAAHEALAKAAPEDKRSLARLVKALAVADPKRAKELAKNLPPVDQLERKIDIDALESSKWMMGAKVVKKTVQSKQEQSPGTPGSELGQKKKTKRKRKTKLPPSADLSKPPDPERWLPRYERTAYRKRRGVRRDVIKGSQGMSTTATDQYDMSKQAPSAATPAAAAKSPRVDKQATESAWQRKQQQKKKGKGRKW